MNGSTARCEAVWTASWRSEESGQRFSARSESRVLKGHRFSSADKTNGICGASAPEGSFLGKLDFCRRRSGTRRDCIQSPPEPFVNLTRQCCHLRMIGD